MQQKSVVRSCVRAFVRGGDNGTAAQGSDGPRLRSTVPFGSVTERGGPRAASVKLAPQTKPWAVQRSAAEGQEDTACSAYRGYEEASRRAIVRGIGIEWLRTITSLGLGQRPVEQRLY